MENDETTSCLLCGEPFSSSNALSQHWKDSSCKMSSIPAHSTQTTSAIVSTTAQMATVVRVPSASVQTHLDAASESHIPEDTGSTNLERKGRGDDGEESATSADGPTEVVEAEPLKDSSSVAVSSSVVPVSILLAHQVGVVTDSAKDDNEGSLSAGHFSHIPEEEAHIEGVIHQDSELSQIPETVHLQPDTLLGQVAMEIHIPMHTQLIVSDYIEENGQTESSSEIYFIEGKVEGLDTEDRQSAIELNVPKEAWEFEEKCEKDDLSVQTEVKLCRTSKVQKYCCEKCGKTYSKSSNFYRHQNVHFGIKFPCDLCDIPETFPVMLPYSLLKRTGLTCEELLSHQCNNSRKADEGEER
eukprot:XP_003726631.2 PREDICTED: uncharacterized protein LOC100890074 [Strongylocentrotus purpuratus]